MEIEFSDINEGIVWVRGKHSYAYLHAFFSGYGNATNRNIVNIIAKGSQTHMYIDGSNSAYYVACDIVCSVGVFSITKNVTCKIINSLPSSATEVTT